ncbi:MAG TPA: hypothetical protein ACFYDZ_00080 [Candidatus Brocadiaceae bacterium]
MDNKKNAGYIIVVVMFILVALTLLGVMFLNLTSIDFNATDNYVNSLQADMVARSGLEYAIYTLKMDKYGTDTIVYNNNSYRYIGTTTLGYDENYDAYTEEWLGTGTDRIFGSASASSNDVDNNGDGIKDSTWLNAPFLLDKGLKAQYAILIEDVGESRVNVNATGNIGTTTGNFVYGSGTTTYDIRLQDILGSTTAKNVVVGTNTARCGHGTPGTTASHFQPRNPASGDRPFNVLDAADFCFGTYTAFASYQSRLRKIINNGAPDDTPLFKNVRGNLTVYSADAIITNNGISGLLLPDNKNYYRLKLDNTTPVGSITSQLQIAGFSQGTATQLAVNIKDYMDLDNDITAYGTPTKYGLEPHPFINELYYTGTSSAQQHQNLIELYNPFDVAIGSSTLSINSSKMDLVLKVTKKQYYLADSSSCTWATGTITPQTYPINTVNFSIQPKGYVVLGYGTQNTAVSLSGTQTVTGFDIYDFDSTYIPQEVTVTLMGSSSALPSGDYLILDEAVPNAYTNTLREVDLLWVVYQVIAYINGEYIAGAMTNDAYNALIAQAGDGLYGPPHTSEKSGNNALTNLVEPDTGTTVIWNPGTNGVSDAISNLNAVITKTNLYVGNGKITSSAGSVLIADALVAINALNGCNCSSNLSVRASIGERKNPLIERGTPTTNWGTATTSTNTLGQVNYSYSLVTTNERKQLVVANNNMISLGEAGHLLTIGYGTQSPYTSNSTYNVAGSSTVDNAKLNLFSGTGTVIPEYFTILDPKNDTIDDDFDGAIGTDTGTQTGDIDGPEIQVPGRININTAPSSVLAALPGSSTTTSIGTWSALQGALITNIINNRPYTKIGELPAVSGMDYFGTDGIDNDSDGLVDEKDEKDLIFTSITNLITTHTNVFAVYVTARIVNSNATQTYAEKKLVAIVDRSVTPIKIRYFRWMTEW